MKENFLTFIKNLNESSYLEYYITYLISPVLTGVKPSSLIGIGNDDRPLLNLWKKEGNNLLFSLDLKALTLRSVKGREIVLIYNEENLLQILNREENKKFLEKLGYLDLDNINKTLTHLYERYSAFHCPHEVGIFLGIPLHDVEAFMDCSEKKCLLCGYWKVFSNEEKAKELFRIYDWSREMVMTYSLQKKEVKWIASILRDSFSCAAL
ncbi:hypothetical protein CPJCM30710_21860 [Clostridium polyendosporum]|uniref:DUF3793 family protein n=1 Tax=Clostridium polyendosporum TaxID=69208 RepID=A0A919VGL8_9CLOT|nr:DUF3793 family protein [Clostridium polyendosporum]GIM29520.1 hypothetical protein CPJCM30710_21860 [Clostridium polyendosporum]